MWIECNLCPEFASAVARVTTPIALLYCLSTLSPFAVFLRVASAAACEGLR
jgi:hypothetical protein